MKRISNKIYETPEIIVYSYHITQNARVQKTSRVLSQFVSAKIINYNHRTFLLNYLREPVCREKNHSN